MPVVTPTIGDTVEIYAISVGGQGETLLGKIIGRTAQNRYEVEIGDSSPRLRGVYDPADYRWSAEAGRWVCLERTAPAEQDDSQAPRRPRLVGESAS